MANEPERPIEKLLRDAARKRRDAAGAPFELHPATRRLLQGEVARQFAKPQRQTGSFSLLVAQLWPRFAWGLSILAVLGVAVWVLLPGTRGDKPQLSLAKNQRESELLRTEERRPPPPASPAVVPPPAAETSPIEPTTTASGGARPQGPVGAVDGPDEQRYGLATKAAPPASAPAAPAPAARVAVTASTADASLKRGDDRSGQPTLAYQSLAESGAANLPKPSAAAPDALAMTAAAALKEDKSAGVAQRFTQVVPGSKQKAAPAAEPAPAQPVLTSFQVEQTGSALRIVDADGSVYSGYVQLADSARRARAVRLETPAAAAAARAPKDAVEERYGALLDSDQMAAQPYPFRVAGTNRSLNQSVVFAGNFLPAPRLASPPLAVTNLSAGTGLGGIQSDSAQPFLLQIPNSRISGKVVVGNGKPVEIHAEPASP